MANTIKSFEKFLDKEISNWGFNGMQDVADKISAQLGFEVSFTLQGQKMDDNKNIAMNFESQLTRLTAYDKQLQIYVIVSTTMTYDARIKVTYARLATTLSRLQLDDDTIIVKSWGQ